MAKEIKHGVMATLARIVGGADKLVEIKQNIDRVIIQEIEKENILLKKLLWHNQNTLND